MKIIDLIDSPNFNPETNKNRDDWSLRDVSTRQVFLDENNRPVCIEHKAMSCVNPELTIYRCLVCSRACYVSKR